MGVDDGHRAVGNRVVELLPVKVSIKWPDDAAVLTALVGHKERRALGFPVTKTTSPKHVAEVFADRSVVEELIGDGDGQNRTDDLGEGGERPEENVEEERPHSRPPLAPRRRGLRMATVLGPWAVLRST